MTLKVLVYHLVRGGATSSTSTTTSTTTSSSDSSSSSSTDDFDYEQAWNEALTKDYSNSSSDAVVVTEDGLSEEYFSLKRYEGYTIVVSQDSEISDLYYHDYEGESHLYFNDNYGNGDAWLKEGYHNVSLALKNTYFDLDCALEELSKIDYEYSDGLYLIDFEDSQILNSTLFQFAWTSDIVYTGVSLNEEGYIESIVGIDNPNLGMDDPDCVQIQLYDIGTTTYGFDLPPAPTSDNVMTYADWSGTDPWDPIFPTDITISLDEYTIDLEEEVELNVAFLPETTNQTSVTYTSSNPEVATISISGTIKGISEGQTTISVVSSNLYQDEAIYSNEIVVNVNGVDEPTLEGLTYALTFDSMDSDGIVSCSNAISSEKNATIKTSGFDFIQSSGKENKWDDGTNLLMSLVNNSIDVTDSSMIIELDEDTATGISFYLSAYWPQDVNNASWVDVFTLSTSVDGVTYNEVADLLPLVQNDFTGNTIKLFEQEFEHASFIKIYMDGNYVGHSFRLGFDEIRLYKQGEPAPLPIPVTSVTLSSDATSMYVGDKMQISTQVLPSNADDKTVSYTSSDTSVATISSTGEVEALKAGTVTISAISTTDRVESNELTLTIEDKPLPEIDESSLGLYKGLDDQYSNDVNLTLSTDGSTIEYDGETYNLTLLSAQDFESYISYSFESDEGYSFDISIEDECIAYVYCEDLDLYVGIFYDTNFLRKEIDVETLTISTTSETTIHIGDTIEFSAVKNPTNATADTVYWYSSDSDVADFVCGTRNELTAFSAGEVTITAECGGVKSNSITITVEPADENAIPDQIVGDELYFADSNYSLEFYVTINSDGTGSFYWGMDYVDHAIEVSTISEDTVVFTVDGDESLTLSISYNAWSPTSFVWDNCDGEIVSGSYYG